MIKILSVPVIGPVFSILTCVVVLSTFVGLSVLAPIVGTLFYRRPKET